MQSNPNQARKRSEAAKKAARTRAAQKHWRELYKAHRVEEETCECGHPKGEHEDCGTEQLVCMRRDEDVVMTVTSHPLEGVCACCWYIEEGS